MEVSCSSQLYPNFDFVAESTSVSLTSLRHGASALLAAAVSTLFPKAQLIEAGAVEQGFYCDFALSEEVDSSILRPVEQRMLELLREEPPLRSLTMVAGNAAEWMRHQGQKLVAKKLLSLPSKEFVDLLALGEFSIPLPRPHPPALGSLKTFCLDGLETFNLGRRLMMRLRGSLFFSLRDLKQYKKRRRTAEERGHLHLGKAMRFFAVGEGLPTWLPRGRAFRDLFLRWWTEEQERLGCQVVSPPPARKSASGPGWSLLPEPAKLLRAEPGQPSACFTTVFSEAPPASLLGLLKTHLFLRDCAVEAVPFDFLPGRAISSLQLLLQWIKIFGFEGDWILELGGQVPKRQAADWEQAGRVLREALRQQALPYREEPALSDRDGPRLVVACADYLGRFFELGSLCIEARNRPASLWTVRRSLFCSFERFTALLLERFEGRIPCWLAPEQARILVVSKEEKQYAYDLMKSCEERGIRVGLDESSASLSQKIRSLKKDAVPYGLVAGLKEGRHCTISVCFPDGTERKGLEVAEVLRELVEKSQSPRLFLHRE